jgi:hypothetical protein
MANKYYYQGVDLDNLCEPNAATGLTTCNACPFQSSYFGNMGGYASYDSSANYDYMVTAFPASTFTQAGSNVAVSAQGYRPRNTLRIDLQTPRTYYIARLNDSALKCYYTSGGGTYVIVYDISASSMGLSKAPYILLFYLAAGGGGGGGGSGTVSAGGGGGGRLAIGYAKIPTITSDSNYTSGLQVVVGGAGAGGAGGTGSNALRGNTGGTSSITNPLGGSVTCYGGTGGANYSPTNGSGGSISYTNSTGNLKVFTSAAANGGGNGGSAGGNMSISYAVAPDFTYSRSAAGGAGPTSQGGGGASYGDGGDGVTSGAGGPGAYGGGGAGGVYTIFNGKSGGNGGNGIARFYY